MEFTTDLKAGSSPQREEVIQLTDLAAEMVLANQQREKLEDAALRISVVDGGCSGLQYNLSFDREVREDDRLVEESGVRIVIDPQSAQYIQGTVLDYVNALTGAGFKFVNPNAERTCGCGTSFSVSN